MVKRFIFSAITILFVCTSSVLADDPVFEKLPSNFSVYAVGTYKGTTPVDVQLDDSGHTVTQATVFVNKPNQSVVLVLSAYDPVLWRVEHTKDTKIAGILVSGYHGQALVGVDEKIPVAISSHQERGEIPYFYATGASEKLISMNNIVKKIVGQEIDQFYNKPTRGKFYIGDEPKQFELDGERIVFSDKLKTGKALETSQTLTSQSTTVMLAAQNKPQLVKKIDRVAKLAKSSVSQLALDELVTQKKLRLATSDDITAWVEKASKKYARFNPDLRVETTMQVGRTYVVLEQVELPNGLFGAHSRNFIIPNDVPFPTGPRCHNRFFKMDGTAGR